MYTFLYTYVPALNVKTLTAHLTALRMYTFLYIKTLTSKPYVKRQNVKTLTAHLTTLRMYTFLYTFLRIHFVHADLSCLLEGYGNIFLFWLIDKNLWSNYNTRC